MPGGMRRQELARVDVPCDGKAADVLPRELRQRGPAAAERVAAVRGPLARGRAAVTGRCRRPRLALCLGGAAADHESERREREQSNGGPHGVPPLMMRRRIGRGTAPAKPFGTSGSRAGRTRRRASLSSRGPG